MTIFHGRDRRLSSEPKIQSAVPAAESSVFSFASRTVAAQAADLMGDAHRELAVLLADGRLEVLAWDGERVRQETAIAAVDDRRTGLGLGSETSASAQLLAVRMTGHDKEDLVLLAPAQRAQLFYVRSNEGQPQDTTLQPMGRLDLLSFQKPHALVPMRLNFDGFSDLMLMSDQAPYLAAITTSGGPPLEVTSSGEEEDGDLTLPPKTGPS